MTMGQLQSIYLVIPMVSKPSEKLKRHFQSLYNNFTYILDTLAELRALSPGITLQDEEVDDLSVDINNQDEIYDDLFTGTNNPVNQHLSTSNTSSSLIGPFKNELEVCLFMSQRPDLIN